MAPVGGAGDAVTRWAVSSCPCVLVKTAKTQLATLEGVVVLYPCMADTGLDHLSRDQLVQLLYRVAEKLARPCIIPCRLMGKLLLRSCFKINIVLLL